MTDQQILQAALQAGLCFPLCWSLVDPTNPDADSSGDWEEAELAHMARLRHFAQLLVIAPELEGTSA